MLNLRIGQMKMTLMITAINVSSSTLRVVLEM